MAESRMVVLGARRLPYSAPPAVIPPPGVAFASMGPTPLGPREWDRSILINVQPVKNPQVQSVNIYRSSTIIWEEAGVPHGVRGAWIRIGSVPAGGGSIVDSMEAPPFGTPDELPLTNTADRPPMPYIDLAQPLDHVVKVGTGIRVMRVVDDAPSQSFLASLLTSATRVDDGIVEDELNNSDLGYDQLEEVARAHLAARSIIEITPTWSSRDHNTHPGRTIFIDMPNLQSNFKIQTVRIGQFVKAGYTGIGVQFAPVYNATASSRRFTINDLLRMVRK